MNILFEQTFRGFFCPALVCALVLASLQRLWRRDPDAAKRKSAVGAAFAVASGYVVGHGLVVGWAFFAPVEKKDWLPWLSLLMVALVAAELVSPLRSTGARWSLRLLASALSTWLVVRPESHLALAAETLAVTVLWLGVESLARRRSGAAPAWSSLVGVVTAGAVLVLSGSASYGQLAVVVAACLSMLVISAWRRPDLTALHGASGIVVVVPAALWLNLHRYSYAEVPVTSALLAGGAMLSGWVAELPAVRRLPPWPRTSVCAVAALVPAAIAVLAALAVWEPAGEY